MRKHIMLTVVVAVLVGGAAFYGGMRYQSSLRGSGTGRFGAGGVAGGRAGQNRPVLGEVLTVDADSLTVKMADGSTKIVNIAPSTTYSKTETGKKEEVVIGTKVNVFGQTNSDGSVTAQNVQINPMMRAGFGGDLRPTNAAN